MKGRAYKWMLVGLMICLLGGTNFIQRGLNTERSDLGLTRVTPLDNAPPLLAFTTVALGGFRGLIANMLWIRANEMQQNDKYFEMVQLSDWITKLQPHFVPVWQYMAWNMAYNISVKFPDPYDRWHWVKSGIELLRDEALRYNPHQTLLYFELSNFFLSKMGADMDDAHMTYKIMWAYEFDQLIGAKPDFDGLIDPKTPENTQKAKILREHFKMDPRTMKEVEEKYGPLEWRLPETHAMYWSVVGMRDATAEEKERLRRMIFHAMQLAARRGRMIENKADKQLDLGPNLAIIPKANASYEEMIAEEKVQAQRESFQQGHRNFIQKSVTDLYLYNRIPDAQAWFDYLKFKYPDQFIGDPTLDEHVKGRIEEEIRVGGRDKAETLVEGFLVQAYLALAVGDDDRFLGARNMAQMCWTIYMARITQFDIKTIEERVKLQPFSWMQLNVINRMLTGKIAGVSPQLGAQLMTRLAISEPPAVPEDKGIELPVPAPKVRPADILPLAPPPIDKSKMKTRNAKTPAAAPAPATK